MQQTEQNTCGKCGCQCHSGGQIKHLNHYAIDGEVQLVFDRAPDIKLSNAPKIVFAIPVGAKTLGTQFVCDKSIGGCGSIWQDTPTVRTANMVPAAFMLSYHSLQMPLNVSTTFMVDSNDVSSVLRQRMTKAAINMGAKYIVYWDDDILPPPDGLYRLYNFMERNPQVGLVSSVCTTRHDPPEPVLYRQHGDGACWDFECGPDAIPEPMMFGGAGFIMARIGAIEDAIAKIKAENNGVELPVWADERAMTEYEGETPGIKKRNIFWGHDVRFWRLLREAGYHTVVHGAVLCDHYDAANNKAYRMPNDAPGFQKVRERLEREKQAQQGGEGTGGIQAGDAEVQLGADSH